MKATSSFSAGFLLPSLLPLLSPAPALEQPRAMHCLEESQLRIFLSESGFWMSALLLVLEMWSFLTSA